MSATMTLPGVDWGNDGTKPVILLSLQPQYWEWILDGSKKYEYRRSFRAHAVQAYIYLSSPRKAIAGLVEFGSPIIDTPSGIAEFAEQQHTGSFAGMLEYLEGKERGFAIPILSYERISPIPLAVLREQFSFTAPQNYMVLDNYPELLTFIRDHSRI